MTDYQHVVGGGGGGGVTRIHKIFRVQFSLSH